MFRRLPHFRAAERFANRGTIGVLLRDVLRHSLRELRWVDEMALLGEHRRGTQQDHDQRRDDNLSKRVHRRNLHRDRIGSLVSNRDTAERPPCAGHDRRIPQRQEDRRMKLIASAVVLAAAFSAGLAAQTMEQTTKSKITVKDGKDVTVTGCVERTASGSGFMLTDAADKDGRVHSYMLVSDDVDLAKHIGHRVEIKGK